MWDSGYSADESKVYQCPVMSSDLKDSRGYRLYTYGMFNSGTSDYRQNLYGESVMVYYPYNSSYRLFRGYNPAKITQPSNGILMVDSVAHSTAEPPRFMSCSVDQTYGSGWLGRLHSDRTSIAFVDGHVATLSLGEISQLLHDNSGSGKMYARNNTLVITCSNEAKYSESRIDISY